ncbi:unnamed protein product [Ectocarpus sp. 12 AP-2014]
MAARRMVRIAGLKPSVSHRCPLPLLGRLGATSSSNRESGADDRHARAQTLVSQARDIHVSRRNESTVLIAGAGIAVSAMVARYGLMEYQKYQAAHPEATKRADSAAAGDQTADGETGKASPEGAAKGAGASAGGFFGAFGKRFYDGGFEEKMTRKEAALILGVRESATAQRIKDSHRRILMINHPDKGGSKYMAAKINEAKEILLKGRK